MTISIHAYALAIQGRGELLAIVIVIAYAVGAGFARGYFMRAAKGAQACIDRLGRKLDRPMRGSATLMYRGMVTLAALLIPGVLLGIFLAQPTPWIELLAVFLLVAWFAQALDSWAGIALWRRAMRGGVALELPGVDTVFADSHGVIRHAIAVRFTAFTREVVAASVWYLLGDIPLMAAYLVLAATARSYTGSLFGWSARWLLACLHAVPHAISVLLLRGAAWFIPRTKPFARPNSGAWLEHVAQVLGIALQVPSLQGVSHWVGTGRAQLQPADLSRALALLGVMALLWVLVLAGPILYNLLIDII